MPKELLAISDHSMELVPEISGEKPEKGLAFCSF